DRTSSVETIVRAPTGSRRSTARRSDTGVGRTVCLGMKAANSLWCAATAATISGVGAGSGQHTITSPDQASFTSRPFHASKSSKKVILFPRLTCNNSLLNTHTEDPILTLCGPQSTPTGVLKWRRGVVPGGLNLPRVKGSSIVYRPRPLYSTGRTTTDQ